MKTLSNAAIEVLSSSLDVSGSHVKITRQLTDRKLYLEVNAALEALGGKWTRGAKAHVFAGDPTDAIDDVLTDGGFHDKKRDLQQFFTPAPLAKRVAELADVRGKFVLEPSAGRGALLQACVDAGAKRAVCVEKDEACLKALESLKLGDVYVTVYIRDFLGMDTLSPFDCVVMNPPFTKGQDVAHVTHAFGFLKPKGKLAAIMSAGVEFRTDKRTLAFRDLVTTSGGSFERLPEDSFKESGTSVRTVLVTMTKR